MAAKRKKAGSSRSKIVARKPARKPAGHAGAKAKPASSHKPAAKPSRKAARPRVSPALLVPEFIGRFDPVIQNMARLGRAMLRQRFPTAIEAVYEGEQAVAIGYGRSEHAADFIVSLAIHAGGVNLYFADGARLPDPKRVLEGAGQGRFVRLRTVADLESAPVAALLAAAVKQSEAALPAGGSGRTVVSIADRPAPAPPRARRPPRDAAR